MKWIYFFILVVCLSGCAPSALTNLAVAPGGVIYQDDFSDPTSGWPRLTDPSGSMDYDQNGSYQMTVNNAGYDLWAVSGYSYQDLKVEVEAKRLEGPDQNRYGLVCRYIDPQNFYFFVVSSDGYEAIGKMKQGVQSLLEQDMMVYSTSIVPGDGPNHLRFDCIGEELTGYANGQAIASTTDGDFKQGDAGLIAGSFDQPGVKINFDNFIVYKP